jgi:hypothetical protein
MRLSDEKLEEILKSCSGTEPLVQAFRQILDNQIADEVSAAIDSRLVGEGRAYNCGRAASLSDLRSFLIESGMPLDQKSQEQA